MWTVLTCLLKFPLTENSASQIMHLNAFALSWEALWRPSDCFEQKVFLQILHSLSLLWITWCLFSKSLLSNFLPHDCTGHVTAMQFFSWNRNSFPFLKTLLHRLHSCFTMLQSMSSFRNWAFWFQSCIRKIATSSTKTYLKNFTKRPFENDFQLNTNAATSCVSFNANMRQRAMHAFQI